MEENDEEFQVGIEVTYLYSELVFRHFNARVQSEDPELQKLSWYNYVDIFELTIDRKFDYEIPIQWIWDILDEYVYQFQTFCQKRLKMSTEDMTYEYFVELNEEVWTLEKVAEQLEQLVKASNILDSRTGKLKEVPKRLTNLHYFGYFAMVNLIRLNSLIGKNKEALVYLEKFNYESLQQVLLKDYSCFYTFLYYSGFSLLMEGYYKESVKVIEQ